MGGGAASQAAVEARSSELNKLILLAPVRVVAPKRLHGNKLFVVSEGDQLRSSVAAAHKQAASPKRLEVLEGEAHAQHNFNTRHGPALTKLIRDFLVD